MRIFALGGAGRICRESIADLVQFAAFDQLMIGDYNVEEAKAVAKQFDDERVDYCFVDLNDKEKTISTLSEYDIVLDGTTISLNDQSTACIAEAGCHGINFNGFGEEYKYDDTFKANGKLMVPGFGMTPGTTNMMAVYAADQMDSVDSIRVSHGAFRPIAFSNSIAETTVYEYDPELPGRVVFEDGELKQVPPFARPRAIQLPEPYGMTEQYIIPHSETVTLSEFYKEKGIRLVEVRGTWPKENMQLIKALFNYGFLNNPKVQVKGCDCGIMEVIGNYLTSCNKGKTTELYGYALHVEIEGVKNNEKIRHTLTHTHPASDGSVKGWEGLRAYTRNVGIPVGIAVKLMMEGKAKGTGALIPEKVFNPIDLFEELKKRDIQIHESIKKIK
ncbi:MAG: saccharopine dehydrogenase NADP-binding domain-containing protein [Carboxylicivirga sp.]|jgi:saccharopine dehydrogenase-like NADP-dependent oxidoreductase|nr:saccharopine dehydrogenase NADP-binding domain-containing protein [Carboxylicivirga sp.]